MKALPIKDFPDYYITDTGDVYSRNYHHTGRIKKIKTYKNKWGYERIVLSKYNKKTHFSIHRLVAIAFIPNPENKPQVNHKNGVKTDNKVSNLEWVSRKENIQHSYKTLHRKANMPWKDKFGALHPRSKIIQQIKNGKTIAEFYGANEAERKTGISHSNIIACCKGRLNYTGGYQWKYKRC